MLEEYEKSWMLLGIILALGRKAWQITTLQRQTQCRYTQGHTGADWELNED